MTTLDPAQKPAGALAGKPGLALSEPSVHARKASERAVADYPKPQPPEMLPRGSSCGRLTDASSF